MVSFIPPPLAAQGPCLSVVMPCFNEEATIAEVVRRVLASPYVRELVVVDDASSDRSAEIVAAVADPRIRLLRQPRNMGKGAALRRGLVLARGPFVVVQDADLEYDPAEYPILLEPLIDGRADVVYGSRFHNSRPHRVLYYWHSVGNHLLTTMSNMVTDLNLTDMETCYKAFRREVLDGIVIEEDRFGFEPEITAKVAAAGHRIYEVGISYSGRTYAEGKKIGWRDGVRALYCIGRYGLAARRRPEGARPGEARPNGRGRSAEGDARAGLAHTTPTLPATLDPPTDATRYADWIVDLMAPYLGGRILAIGASHVGIPERLARHGEVVVTEPSERRREALRARFAGSTRIRVASGRDGDAASRERGGFDHVVLVDVLEHAADDVRALELAANELVPGGHCHVVVPALEGLTSPLDRRLGRRRYDRAGLITTVYRAGLEVVEARYVDCAGALASWLLARRLGRVPTGKAAARLYDRAIVPWVRALEEKRRMPIGQSLFVVARRPSD